MEIIIPETIGGTLPSGTYDVVIESVEIRTSQSGNPKALVRYAVVDNDEFAGFSLFENFSLLPQALWRLNDLFRLLKKKNIPKGRYSSDEFEQILNDELRGERLVVSVTETITDDGTTRNEIVDKSVPT